MFMKFALRQQNNEAEDLAPTDAGESLEFNTNHSTNGGFSFWTHAPFTDFDKLIHAVCLLSIAYLNIHSFTHFFHVKIEEKNV